VSLIKTTNPTWLFLGGPIIARLDQALASGDLSLAGARGVLAANSARKLRQLLGVRVHQVFGITEGVIMFTRADDPEEAQDTTHGRPVSQWDRVKVLVPGTDREVAVGEIGEPAFKGPYTMHGYYRAEERNRETFTADGFYLSGDLMQQKVIEGKTYYVFCGRLKDLVSRGGEKINCEEVEMAVAGHPAVAAVACVSYPDPVFDERLCAVLILRAGHQPPTVAQMGQHLLAYGLAKFKWPERIEVVNEFPLSAAGKVNKAGLREMVRLRIPGTVTNAGAPGPGG
jgi:non-ribosomal peptide synthetase component E (peptide arylation enzyme)